MTMYISQERFEHLVHAAAAEHPKVLKVIVEGFGFILRLDARRTPYHVKSLRPGDRYPDHSQPVPGGMTLPQVVDEISRAMRAMAR